MQARIFRDVAYFDRALQELRSYVETLLHGRPGFSFPVRQALTDLSPLSDRKQRQVDKVGEKPQNDSSSRNHAAMPRTSVKSPTQRS